MNLLFDSWQVLSLDKWPILVILACVSWGMVITVIVLRSITDLNHNLSEYSSLALAGWIVPLFPVSILVFVLAVTFNIRPNLQVAIAGFILSLGLLIWANRRAEQNISRGSVLTLVTLLCLFLLSTFLHLAFISETPLPPYIDSAQHYLIIQNLVKDFTETNTLKNFIWPVPIYYHLGFHFIAALLVATFQLNIAKLILILGQIIVGSAAIPLFFLVKLETGSDAAGLIAVLLGSFGWYMPSFAVNWGKYPALLSLQTIQFCLSILYLIGKYRKFFKPHWLIAIGAFSTAVSFIIHTRSIILIGIGFTAWMFAGWWRSQKFKWRILLLGIMSGSLLIESVLINSNSNLRSLFDPYFGSAVWITGSIGLLSILAFKKYPKFSFACLSSIFFLLLGLFIPIPHITDLTLLDRPLVEMILFIPLSLLGGLGYMTLSNLVSARFIGVRMISTFLFVGAIIVHAFMSYNFYPSDCCVIVTQDDSVALDWLDKHTPPTTLVAISSTELRITASSEHPQTAGSDAGVWITPLVNRPTFLLPFSTDFTRSDTLSFLCEHGISDIYIGNKDQSFNRALVEEKPDWYRNLLFLPGAQIFRVIGCK